MAKKINTYLSENEVFDRICNRFEAPAWVVLPQVRSTTGYSRKERYADALAMSVWPSRGLELHGFEIKVNRADWRKEFRTPEKAEEIAQYCHKWWIVAANDTIVLEGELPPNWGLLIASKNGKKFKRLKEVTPAKVLRPRPLL